MPTNYVHTDRDRLDELPPDVFAGELEDICSRRKTLGLRPPPTVATPGPNVDYGLVGLALSGGGIRSASFSLGVLQALDHHGLFRYVDYLSSVSGGGYVAGSLSSLFSSLRHEGYDLRFMSVDETDDLEDEGNSLVIVAFVGTDLHIRIFDADGKKVVDRAENELIPGEALTALKERLSPIPDESSLSQPDKQEIIGYATSSAGHTRRERSGLELASVAISGIPRGSRLADRILENDAPASLAASELDQAYLTLPPGYSGVLKLSGVATYRDPRTGASRDTAEVPVRISGNVPASLCPDHAVISDTIEVAPAMSEGVTVRLIVDVQEFPFRHRLGRAEGARFKHLRTYANYLAPRKLLARVLIPALLLRGILVNFWIYLPYVLAGVFFTTIVSGERITKAMRAVMVTIPAEQIAKAAGAAPPEASTDGCNLRLKVAPNDNTAEELILKFKKEFESKKTECAVLSVRATGDSEKWIIAGFNDAGEFRTMTVDDPGHELPAELKEKPLNKSQTVKLATSNLGRAQSEKRVNVPFDALGELESFRGGEFHGLAVFGVPRGVEILNGLRGNDKNHAAQAAWLIKSELSNQLRLAVPEKHQGDIRLLLTNYSGVPETLDSNADPVADLYATSFWFTQWWVIVTLVLLSWYPVWLALWGFFLTYLLRRPPEAASASLWLTRDRAARYLVAGPVVLLAILAFVELQPIAVYLFHRTITQAGFASGALEKNDLWLLILGLSVVVFGVYFLRMARKYKGLGRRLGVYLVGFMGPVILWILYLTFTSWTLNPEAAPVLLSRFVRSTGGWFGVGEVSAVWAVFTILLLTLALTRSYFDINKTSLHRFYRDRLSQAFLLGAGEADSLGKLPLNDGQKLSKLDRFQSPYHLINTTLNTRASKRVRLLALGGAPFIFSRRYIGSQVTGYRVTEELEELDSHVDLGTAIAISGAAAAPNMGEGTIEPLTPIMTLLNVRLNYWLPNPWLFAGTSFSTQRAAADTSWMQRRLAAIPFPGALPNLFVRWLRRALITNPGSWYLIREMLGRVHERTVNVNLSDGGHIENLGLYELVRRRCQFIIVSDAEHDPQGQFKGLAQAIRLLRIEMGIEVEIDLDFVSKANEKQRSGVPFAVGVIRYGPGKLGYLLYIKLSVSGDENVYVREYGIREPEFPHETTGDQFFDEAQFEAYLALGYHIGHGIFSGTQDERLKKLVSQLPDRAGYEPSLYESCWKEPLMQSLRRTGRTDCGGHTS